MEYKIYEKGRGVEFVDEDPDYGEHYIYVPFGVIRKIAQEITERGGC